MTENEPDDPEEKELVHRGPQETRLQEQCLDTTEHLDVRKRGLWLHFADEQM